MGGAGRRYPSPVGQDLPAHSSVWFAICRFGMESRRAVHGMNVRSLGLRHSGAGPSFRTLRFTAHDVAPGYGLQIPRWLTHAADVDTMAGSELSPMRPHFFDDWIMRHHLRSRAAGLTRGVTTEFSRGPAVKRVGRRLKRRVMPVHRRYRSISNAPWNIPRISIDLSSANRYAIL